MKPQLELSRPIDVSRISPTGDSETLIADPAECMAIATRLGIPAVHSLRAELGLWRWRGAGVRVTGRILAEVEQVCVVTLEPFRSEISDEVERYFLPGASEADASADVDPFSDGVIELGEVVVESLSLALDPYPRKPGVTFEAGDATTEEGKEQSPFAALASLRTEKR
jgi:hypothetical protein